MGHVLLLVGCAAVIYLSCEWFVNAVEWLGARLNVGPLAVGTILAALGTALPESVVTFVAVVFGHDNATKDIGVGAALGGPLVLATISYGVTGAVILLVRRRTRARVLVGEDAGADATSGDGDDEANRRKLARDQTWFLTIFIVKVALGLVAFAVKPWLGLAFFAAYGLYFWREIRGGGGNHLNALPRRNASARAAMSAANSCSRPPAPCAPKGSLPWEECDGQRDGARRRCDRLPGRPGRRGVAETSQERSCPDPARVRRHQAGIARCADQPRRHARPRFAGPGHDRCRRRDHYSSRATRSGTRTRPRSTPRAMPTSQRQPTAPAFAASSCLEQLGVPFVAIRPGTYLDQVTATSGDPFTNRRFTWLGNPAIPMTFVLTPDIARNLVDAVDAQGIDGQRIDIGWDRLVSMSDIAQIASRQLGRQIRVRAIPIGLLHTARTLLGPFMPAVTDLFAMIDWLQTGRFVADTTRQSEIFGDAPTAEDAITRLEKSLGHRPR